MKTVFVRCAFVLFLLVLMVVPFAVMAQDATATVTSTIEPQRVTFTGFEDLQIIGLMYVPDVTPAPTLLLIHEAEGKKEVWDTFAREWAGAGYTVVAIDARHHGETGGYGGWADVLKDMPLVLEQLKAMPEVKPDALGIIGASMGGGAAYFACTFEESCRTAVLLSPAPMGFSPDLVAKFGERSVMVVAAEKDGNFANTAKQFEENPAGKAEVTIVSGSDHGTQILRDMPEVVEQIHDWLTEELPVKDEEAALETTGEVTLEATTEATASP